jgi:hypothetical protein
MKKTMAAVLALVVAPAVVRASDDYRDWTHREQENIRRSFNLGAGARKLVVESMHGFVHVTGKAGSQVQVNVDKRIYAETDRTLGQAKSEVKLDITQDGNTLRLREDGPWRHGNDTNYRGDHYYGYRVIFDMELEVPPDTEVDLHTLNNEITVRNTTADYDVHCLNGRIEMEGVSGSGNVHTLNGKVKVGYSKNPVKATNFHTLNGTVDVYFQDGLNADMSIHKLNGAVYTDFDVTALSPVRFARGNMSVRAGQGGPALSFHTLNGSIRIHKNKI